MKYVIHSLKKSSAGGGVDIYFIILQSEKLCTD